MHAIISLGMGYVLGCISPAAYVSGKRNVDLTQEGTGNLGATNAALILGKKAGIFVALFDIFKSWLAFKLAWRIFERKVMAGIIASIGTILGHCFPANRKFRGGKGLAAFGGLLLAYQPLIFAGILIPAVILIAIFNTGVAAPMFASVAFPVMVYLNSGDIAEVAAVSVACLIIVVMHLENLKLALHKDDVVNTKEFFQIVFKKKEK